MKRSQSINLSRMRKQPSLTLAKLATAVAGVSLLAGCSDSNENSTVYNNVDSCAQDNPGMAAECQAAYEKAKEEAVRTAPKFETQGDCEAQFGQCTTYQNNGHNWFMPLMAGFMISRALDHITDRRSAPVFTGYGGMYGGYYGANGRRYGDVRQGPTKVSVPKSTYDPKPTVTRTIDRGGFGSTASAKSSWGSSSSSWSSSSSSSSRSFSWGG
ncbi:DUF1190 domain-containing protein [Pokkaliibacter sp. CJK22405]|uniref:DUF1190 domain-containing protein n=1 Tax=Pokkaliibacter sp. CJK22405 TaxID=3384615 RepID=UPI0039848126